MRNSIFICDLKMRDGDGMRKNNIFTLIELLVSISIIVILIMLLLPVLGRAKASVRDITCKNQLKNIGTYMMLYIQDSNDFFPYCQTDIFNSYFMRLESYAGYNARNRKFTETNIFRCPMANDPDNSFYYCTYGYNGWMWKIEGGGSTSSIARPLKLANSLRASEHMLLIEKGWLNDLTTNYPWYAFYYPETGSCYMNYELGKRHNSFGNLLFVDCHIGKWKTLPANGTAFWTGK